MKADELARGFPELAKNLEPDELQRIGEALTPHAVKAGERVLEHGKASDSLFLIQEGELEASLTAGERVLRLGTRGKGEWVGELGFVVPGPASADVVAKKDARLQVMRHEAFERLRREMPGAAVGLLDAISRDVAGRLRHCSSGMFKRGADGKLEIATAATGDSPFVDFLKRLLGFRPKESFDLGAFLRSLPAFQSLSDPEFDALEAALALKDFPAGHAFIEQGGRAEDVFFILDGRVAIQARRPGAGGFAVDKEVGSGAILGLVALVDGGPRSATCTTLSPTRVAVLPNEAARMLMNAHARIGCAFQLSVAAQLARDAREMNETIVEAIRRASAAPTS